MVCDLQERFAPDPSSTSSTSSAIRSASSRRLPLGRTRLSDRAVSLGPTVEPLKSLVLTQPVAKTKFSMLVPEVDERLDQLKAARFTDTVVLCDIETHVCVVATCIDLIHRGYNVSVLLVKSFITSLDRSTTDKITGGGRCRLKQDHD
jgi:hypothetical protein